MPNSPYAPRPLNPPPDPELWRLYERANDRAHRQYLATPTACVAGSAPASVCRICRITRCLDDLCAACKAAS